MLRVLHLACLLLFTTCCYGSGRPWWTLRGVEFDRYILDAIQKISPAPEFAISDDYPTTPELLRRTGYTSEEYNVTTEDGYILTVFRITGYKVTKKKPILLLPGNSGGSDLMVASGNDSIGTVLAAAGFDVWLGNTRGNNYGISHISLSSKRKKFWNFSFHEMAYFDLPAMLDHILLTTRSKKASYLGHSAGCTLFLVMAATRPEYDAKISAAILLGQVAVQHPAFNTSIIQNFAQRLSFDFMRKRRVYEFNTKSALRRRFIIQLCHSWLFQPLCIGTLMFNGGGDVRHWDFERAINLGSWASAGTSVKAIEHYKQVVTSGRFAEFDYGPEENLKHYGSKVPPLYDYTKIKAPVAIFIGKGDLTSSISMGKILESQLQNLIMMHIIDFPKFNHLDFFLSTDLKKAYLGDVIKVLDAQDSV